ncbi:MAG: hypothetical protein ABIO76_12095 [Ginsengibacter sp.]
MQKSVSIQLKAAFLIIVFSLNTVIGFACAMGVDLDFNSKHHHDNDDTALIETSVPVSGKEHKHHNEERKQHHDEVNSHHHDEETKVQHDSKGDSEKGGCCNHEVIKFQNLEKNLNQDTPVIYAQIFATIHSNIWRINIFNCFKILPRHYKVCVFHPPRTDILIAIQRFQI